ncbi:hypothetical protein NFI08_16335 [Halomonas sp. EF61]|uniref:hypothetical protein n=2 Tax=unclassified Halomonas TaxID=2609666 RepID=UPI0032DFDEA8
MPKLQPYLSTHGLPDRILGQPLPLRGRSRMPARFQVRSVLTDPDSTKVDYWQVVDTHLNDDVIASYHDCEAAEREAEKLNRDTDSY